MSTLLITGGNGFIGSYLLKELNLCDYNIILLKRSSSDTYRINSLINEIHVYDIDKIALEDIFKNHKINGVIHLSTFYVKTHVSHDIDKMIETNITFPTKILDLSIKHNVNFFINTGTFFEYSLFANPINESSKKHPYNLYAATKLSFEHMLELYSRQSNIHILSLKLSAPFGYNDNYKLIPYLITSILTNQEVILEKGEQEWDFIYVKDVISAFLQAIKLCLNSKRTLFEEILIGSGKKTKISKITNILNKIHKKNLIHLKNDYKENQIFEAYLDISKAKNMLQWVPQYSIEEGLEETYNLYKENQNEK
ncbi:NAD-dependent epimerase/dehydratase family protein [Sulfurimonas indica]|uniref:NAD-dependent epimerase/dehydratase family protein n=1 Tax=Sulfurimonas indica TaxID=2508707 RepID=UPI001264FD2F|nr:NAD(P)-dependent oxidoreductase [Sulfurimonas indica]